MTTDGRLATALALALVAALVLAAVPLPAAADEAIVVGRPELSLSVPDARVVPGENATVDVFVVNDAVIVQGGPQSYVDRVTTARATTIEIDAVPGIDVVTREIPLGRVAEGLNGPVPVAVTVPETVPPGRYRLPVEITYTHSVTIQYDVNSPTEDPEFNDATRTVRTAIPVVVEERARFRIDGVRTDAQIGGSGAATVTVANVGSERARDASLTLGSPSDDLALAGGREAASFLGTVEPGERRQIEVPVAVAADAERRNYTLVGRIDYTDPDGIARVSEELRGGLRPIAEQSFSLAGVESTLRVDHEGRVRGVLTNDGPLSVVDAVVVFEPASPTFDAGETEFAVPDLAPGASAPFAFDVEVSSAADPGARQLRFVVAYETERGDERRSDPLFARIEVGPERDPFALERRTATVRAGGSDRLVLVVTNVDDERLTDVSAKLFVDDPIATGDDEAFVGALAPGESAEIGFEVSAAGGAFPKAYPVSVDFEYDRPDGRTELSDTYRLPVEVTERRGGGFAGGLAIGPALLVAAGAALALGAVAVLGRRD